LSSFKIPPRANKIKVPAPVRPAIGIRQFFTLQEIPKLPTFIKSPQDAIMVKAWSGKSAMLKVPEQPYGVQQ